MKKQIETTGLLAMCMLVMSACSNTEEVAGENSDKLVELQIAPSIIQARDVTATGAVTGTSFSNGASIAVYANSTTTNAASNNFAIYTVDNSSQWSNSDTGNKIYLSSEDATIYANYPSGVTATHSSAVTAESTIAVGTFAGSSTSDASASTITAGSNSTTAINACSGEIDYMYATPASNINNKSTSVTIAMNHAMSMVSFRVYKADTYNNNGHLTQITLDNVSTGTTLAKPGASGGTATMKLGNGEITLSSLEAATYTRVIKEGNAEYYTLKAAPAESGTENSPAFSILVYPINAKIESNSIKATFKIDDQDYTVNLPVFTADVTSGYSWTAGKNHVYKVTLGGKELTITSVTITDWDSTGTPINGGDLTPVVPAP
ncbi:fimbrillin family protein [Phocaeicola sp.]